MKKKTSKKTLLKRLKLKAWNLTSEYVRRKEGCCFTCDKEEDWKKANCGHFVHKNSMDYDLNNLHRQCTRCNLRLHGNLGVYAIRLDKKYGIGTAEALTIKGQGIKQHTIEELEKHINYLKGELKKYESPKA